VAGLVARRPRGAQLFFAVLALISIAIAVNTGPISRTVDQLPLLDQANLDRVLILASFAIAMLAAFGLQQLLDGTVDERRRMLIAAAVVALVPVVALLAAHPSWLGEVKEGVKVLFGAAPRAADVDGPVSVLRWLGFAAAAILLFAAVVRSHPRRELVIGAAIALAALDLLTIVGGYNPAIAQAQASPRVPPAVLVMRRLTAGSGRVVGIDGLEPNTASLWDLDDARGHEDPTVGRIAILWSALGGGLELNSLGIDPGDPRSQKLLDVFGVRAVLLTRSARVNSKLRSRLGPIAYAGPGGVVVSNPEALPRAFVAYHWRTSPGRRPSALLMASSTAQQARDDPVIETEDAAQATTGGSATPARIISSSDTKLTLDVRAKAAGQVVLLDTFYPGWHAEVDGRAEPIRAADAAFRSVAVTPGHHTVRFYYHPATVIIGGAISVAALLAIIACLVFTRWRSTTSERPAPERRR
jgi:hypothetical protein